MLLRGHSPWKKGARRAYALTGPMPEYWPTNSSEKKMGKAITNTIMMKGIRKAPARRGEERRIYSILFEGGGFIKICPLL